jgi:hypothetical protein
VGRSLGLPQPTPCQPQLSLSGGRGVTGWVVVGRPRGAAPPMPRTAALAKSIWLSRFSGLEDRTVGMASGRVFGHATATRLTGGVAAAQLGGTDIAPIEEARPLASCRRVDPLAHSSAIEIDDILRDFSPHRAVRAHQTDIYREDSIVGNIPLAYIFLSSLILELRFK